MITPRPEEPIMKALERMLDMFADTVDPILREPTKPEYFSPILNRQTHKLYVDAVNDAIAALQPYVNDRWSKEARERRRAEPIAARKCLICGKPTGDPADPETCNC